MFDAIKKFLDSTQKGVLIVEDGQPKYVVLPFEEYQKSSVADANKIVPKEEKKEVKPVTIDDSSAVQQMIDYELSNQKSNPDQDLNIDINDMLAKSSDPSPDPTENLKNVNLEDLPF